MSIMGVLILKNMNKKINLLKSELYKLLEIKEMYLKMLKDNFFNDKVKNSINQLLTTVDESISEIEKQIKIIAE